ncbi:PaaI family thioesterase [Jatrophihabitans telluris]|uniref:PaaI family thioesterase n=1 Tax=Jatrophihabitans telluris TaxID=2038343 RepID=A0ABY4QSN0_9ACTN|nr:PaaI family thioesterase [Jatrophihabitans telluris]UQX86794.1 PaaI family thioesterase [Jatrophihabitans telluris]
MSQATDLSIRQAQEAFAQQGLMDTLQAEIVRIEAGRVDVAMPVRPEITQQDGFVHAGAVTAILDTACGFAASTLMPPGSGVLSVDFTVHLMRPSVGEQILAVAEVVKPGRTITFVRAEAFAIRANGDRVSCALMTASMATISPDQRPTTRSSPE